MSHESPLGIFFNSTEHRQRYIRNLVPNKMGNKMSELTKSEMLNCLKWEQRYER